MGMQRGTAPFQPKARIIKLLGEELITNEVIAIVELVKNSYDADATSVDVVLEDVTNLEEGRIYIRDDGCGMALNTVLDVWLQPGTHAKKDIRERGQTTQKFHRPILGEKGVGRFAAQKIGSLITLTTKTKVEKFENIVEIDWKEFDEDKFLSEVSVKWLQVEPKAFSGDKSGTIIDITFLRKAWTEEMVGTLAKELASLQSPFAGRENFEIHLKSDEFPQIGKEVLFPKEMLEKSVYSFIGKVTESGLLKDTKYVFNYPAFSQFNRTTIVNGKDIRDKDFVKEKKLIKPFCGEFTFKFYVWDLDPMSMTDTISRAAYLRFIKPHTGIRVYRDSFRVWPYGTSGNDWLELDMRRVNNMPKCLSNNQVVGLIDINSFRNLGLKDKTDREGLIENTEFRHFKTLVLAVLNELEILRRQDKDKVDRLRQRKTGKEIDQTTAEIEKLRKKITEHSHTQLYGDNVNSVEKAHDNYKTDILEKLLVAAGIGTAALMPAHEIQIQLKDLMPFLSILKEDLIKWGFGSRIVDNFAEINRIMDILWEVSEGALELTKRELKTFSLNSAVIFSLKIKKQTFERNDIDYEVVEKSKDKITIKGYSNLVITALLNILDNAAYWLQHKTENRKIKITIKRDSDFNPIIVISDTGPGIFPEDLPYLGNAFYTRKPRGTGLGLFISKRCMEANDGKISFGFHSQDPDYLEGANVLLTFARTREVTH